MVKRNICLFFSVYVSLLFLTGCWDELAIEERGFVIGTAVDIVGENEEGKILLKETNQFVVPAGASTPSQQGGGGTEPFMNISSTGTSMYVIDQRMSATTRKIPFFEHLKVLIVSEEVIKTPNLFESVLDNFLRNQEMRRGLKVLVTKGEAEKLLYLNPEEERFPAMYIDKLFENSKRKTMITLTRRIGDINEYILAKNDYVLPLFSPDEKHLKYEGGAVIQGGSNQMVGVLTEEEMAGFNLIKEESETGSINVDFGSHVVTYSLDYAKSRIKVKTDGDNKVKVSVEIKASGDIAEVFGVKPDTDYKSTKEVEKGVENEIKRLAEQTIKKAQDELNTDIFQIDNILNQRHYEKWQKLKNNWTDGENVFADTEFNVKVEADIQSTGTSELYQYD